MSVLQVLRTPQLSLRWKLELLWGISLHRLNIRYKETLLGFGWILLQPVGLTIIFNYIRRIAAIPVQSVPYPIFTATGLIAWSLTALVVTQSTGVVMGHSPLIKRVPLPKILLPISVLVTSVADLAVMALLLVGLFFYYHLHLTIHSALVVIPLLTHLCLLLGLSCIMSLAVVFLRDIGHAANSLLQLWFLASPVFYPSSMVPAEFKWIARWNPMTGLIEGYRSTLLFGHMPPMEIFCPAVIVSLAVMGLGLLIFMKVEGTLADML